MTTKLDIVYLLVTAPLLLLSTYLFISSVAHKFNDCAGFYTSCVTNSHWRVSPRIRIYDWIGLNQYANFLGLFATTVFALVAVLRRNRAWLFIAIQLYLMHLIQLAFIESSDDRDFPENIFRDGFTAARYSLIYLDNSIRSVALKGCFLLLTSAEFVLLIVRFVLLRYESIRVERPRNEQ